MSRLRTEVKDLSVLDIGEEITAIIVPTSICMFFSIFLVRALADQEVESAPSLGEAYYREEASDSKEEKIFGGIVNAVILIAAITVMTFFMVLLFKYRCTSVIWGFLGCSGFTIFAIFGGDLFQIALEKMDLHLDLATAALGLWNFAVVGTVAVFFSPSPLFLKQGYLIFMASVTARVFTMLPEWSTFLMLIALALYDLAAVLLPLGPLKVLVELAQERQEVLPALVYESRPPTLFQETGVMRRRRLLPPSVPSTPTARSHRPSSSSLLLDNPASFFPFIAPSSEAPLPPGSAENSSRGCRAGGGGAGGGGGLNWSSRPLTPTHTPETSRRGGNSVWSSSAFHAGSGTFPTGLMHLNTEGSSRGFHSHRSSPAGSPRPEQHLLDLSQRGWASVFSSSRISGERRPRSECGGGGAGGSDCGSMMMNTDQEPLLSLDDLDDVQPTLFRCSEVWEEDPHSSDAPRVPEGIKLGLGDFIFYSVLVGRAAMYDMMVAITTYLAVTAGLVCTLLLLYIYQKALPALPVSIFLGIACYLLGRMVLEPVFVGLSANLLTF